MDGIQLYGGPPHPPASHAIAARTRPPAPSLPKGSSDYLRALRRRTWLVLAIGVTLSVAGAVVVVRLPAVYRATAQISIEPPTYDATLSTLVSHDVGRNDPEAALKYVPNQLVKLQSKGLAEQVVSHPDFDQPAPAAGDPAQELLNNLQTRPLPKSDYIVVTLEGTDPERTAKQLNKLLEIFRDEAEAEKDRTIDDIKQNAMASLDKLTKELKELDESINADLKNSKIIAPGGKNLLADRYETGPRDSSRRSRFACTRSSSNPTWRSSSPASGIGTAPRLATPSSPTCTGRGGSSSSAWRCTSRRSARSTATPR